MTAGQIFPLTTIICHNTRNLSMNIKFLSTLIALPLLIVSLQVLSGETGSTGSFSGANDHVTTGEVRIVKTDAGLSVVLSADFSLDGAPDPKVGLGKNGEYLTELAHLKSLNGEQTYLIPASTKMSDFDEVFIWCKKFNVSLGSAKLK